MIRGPRATAIAVRDPDGRIVLRSDIHDHKSTTEFRRVPLLRGVLTLYDTLVEGVKSLYWSSKVAAGRKDEPLGTAEAAVAAITLTAAAGVFIAGPVLATGWIEEFTKNPWAEVGAEGLLRIAMLLGYISFVGRLPEVKRVFAYHGAEHRTVHAYEHGVPLTVDAVREFPNAHPRCGTAFLLTVGVISLVVFASLGTPPMAVRILERVILTPLIAGLAYEFIRASQAQGESFLVRLIRKPNIWLQGMTTRDPEDDQIEVAIAAFNAVLAAEAAIVPEATTEFAPVEVESSEDGGGIT